MNSKNRIYNPISLPELKRIDSPNGRKYLTPEGNQYPSVTTIFSVIENPELEIWKNKVGKEEAEKIVRRAGARGTWLHEQAEYFLKGGEKFVKPGDTVSTMLYMHAWKAFRPLVEKIGEVKAIEAQLYSDKMRLAGTVDCIGYWDGKLSVIDFKTSSRRKFHEDIDTYWMQTAAYSVMWYELTGEPITQLVVLMYVEDDDCLVFVDNTRNWIKPLLEVRDNYKKKFEIC